MRFTWDERKRRGNLKALGFDFQTDWKRVRATKDKDIVVSAEHPEAEMKHIVRGIVRRGLKPVAPKASVALRLDSDVLSWFRA